MTVIKQYIFLVYKRNLISYKL